MSRKTLGELGRSHLNVRIREILGNVDENGGNNELINEAIINHGGQEQPRPQPQQPRQQQLQPQPQIDINDFIDNFVPDVDQGEERWIPEGPYDQEDIPDNDWPQHDFVGSFDRFIDLSNESNEYQFHFQYDFNEDENIRGDFAEGANANVPMYNNARITRGESMLLLLELKLRNNLSMVCLEAIMKVIELHCPQQNYQKNSIFKFMKYFGYQTEKISKNYYCSYCTRELANASANCPTCPAVKNSYFILLSLVDQLQYMYDRPGFYEDLQSRHQRNVQPGEIQDVYDGQLYKDMEARNLLNNRNNISLNWYVDGIPVFKSSKVSCTPIYLTINELPANKRKKRENTMLAGLWYGNKKPQMNLFMYKLREDLEKLARGITIHLPDGRLVLVKGILLTGVCDLPAKCDVLNFVQFNGKCGCPGCFTEGGTIRTGPRTCKHVYPYEAEVELRTSELCIQYANEATLDAPVLGVKGHTALSKIMPDYIRGTAIDRMHGVEGGGVKKLIILWFDAEYSAFPFSLRAHSDVINARLLAIKPPKFIHRLPRTIADLVHWKASELKTFFFYYSVAIFQDLMDEKYYNHYLLLVLAVVILSSDKISVMAIDVAEDFLKKFVREFQELYGLRFCTINIHQLIHLPQCVRNLGPLSLHTCYEFEDLNGQLLNQIHGTWHLETQVAHSQIQYIKKKKLVDALPDGEIKKFCIDKKKQVSIIEEIFAHGYSVGSYKCLDELNDIRLQFLNTVLGNNNIQQDNNVIKVYYRLLKNEKLYVSVMYDRDIETFTAVVKYDDNGMKIGLICCFLKINDTHFAVIREKLLINTLVGKGDQFNYDTSGFFYQCRNSDQFKVIPVLNILEPCFFINVEDRCQYVSIPINSVEKE